MDDHQINELLENLGAWGEEFRANQHGATLTILRAKKTIMDQAARIAQMNKPMVPRCTGCGGMMLSENWTWCANCGHHRQREDMTPESDKKATDIIGFFSCSTVPADFARKLERERNAPCSAICGNCKHYEPHRDSQTQRVHPSKQGRCGWKPNIKWPMAYRRNGFGSREQDPMVYPVGVWKHTDAKTCACFSPNAEPIRSDVSATSPEGKPS